MGITKGVKMKVYVVLRDSHDKYQEAEVDEVFSCEEDAKGYIKGNYLLRYTEHEVIEE
jgi:hypothetical protein